MAKIHIVAPPKSQSHHYFGLPHSLCGIHDPVMFTGPEHPDADSAITCKKCRRLAKKADD